MAALGAWARANPKRLGRLSLLLGLFLMGLLSRGEWAREARMEWKNYSVLSSERISTPHHGQVDRGYRLKLADDAKIGVASAVGELFNQALLLRQPLPVEVEVYADHEAQQGIIWARGMRLKSGESLLDPVLAKEMLSENSPLAVIVGGIFIVLGVFLQFKVAVPPAKSSPVSVLGGSAPPKFRS